MTLAAAALLTGGFGGVSSRYVVLSSLPPEASLSSSSSSSKSERSGRPKFAFDPEGLSSSSSPRSLLWSLLRDPSSSIANLVLPRKLSLTIHGYDTTQERPIPPFYDHAANVWDTITAEDQPALVHVPRAGGTTLAKLMSHCLGMVTASKMVTMDPNQNGLLPYNTLAINTHTVTGARYLNVDPSTHEGLDRAVFLNAVPSRLADVVIAHDLQWSSPLYDSVHRSRLFLMIRHPVKREVDQFYYMQRSTWEDDYDPAIASMTLEEYAASDKMVENYVVRMLLHRTTEEVTPEDVETAKHILRRKFLVGVHEWFDLSVVRFERYFGWWEDRGVLTNTTVNYCHHKKIADGDGRGDFPRTEPGSLAHKRLAVRNWADLELYFYAKNLFYRQAALV